MYSSLPELLKHRRRLAPERLSLIHILVSDVNTVVTTGETVLYSGAKDPQVDYDKLLGENGLTDKDAKYFWNYNSGKYIPNTTEKYCLLYTSRCV